MTTRERILDAAAHVMRELGLAHATTKEIAREAGFSEATLYKHFQDKHDIFLGVIVERLPPLGTALMRATRNVGQATVHANLEEVARAAIDFYSASFPMAGSMLAEPDLIARQRATNAEHGHGPDRPVRAVADYVRAERDLGRLRPEADPEAIAALLMGACFQRAFLEQFVDEVPGGNAAVLVGSLLGSLLPERQ